MTLVVVLDSIFLSDLLQRKKPVEAVLARLESEGEPLRIPAAVWIETLHALAPRKRAEAARELERTVTFIDVTREIADHAARLQHELRREGSPLGWHDLQIATTALHLEEPLVSNDEAFDSVPGLVRLEH